MYSTAQVESQVSSLQKNIADTEAKLRELKLQLHKAQVQYEAARDLEIAYEGGMPHGWQDEIGHILSQQASTRPSNTHPLPAADYQRYGRQMIMPEIGLRGQLRLKESKVLIIGTGGLGCPAAAYLAGAGVGTIGLVDGDTVEVSNLHRQILHTTSRVGTPKVESAKTYLEALNPMIEYNTYPHHLSPTTALDIMAQYSLVLDCTDNPTSRYLISDACVLARKPLVSASALRTDGQLIVLNNPPALPGSPGGPCYRCVWPRPPPAESVVSCGEGGILGPVVGTMGLLQALEAIKIIVAGQPDASLPLPNPCLTMFSAYSTPQFRSVRLRSRRSDCAACGAQPSISAASLRSGSMDYVAFCGVANPVSVLSEHERVGAADFARLWNGKTQGERPVLVDVRDRTQFELCNLPGSVNVPWSEFPAVLKRAVGEGQRPDWLEAKDLAVVCKLGNDSQLAARLIMDTGLARGNVVDIRGGFRAWRSEVDDTWPDY
ncbi:hypothetical protein MBLNU457_2363t1 [Dothideomycetes sp. NU457]